ncbi:MAG: hypothetical protein GC171_01485 [Terrimonas sp.]|nr:hypothetical protein [Terrimonas sp.]
MKLKFLNLSALFILGFALAGFSQTADEIISKHIEAIGGADAWSKINSIKQEGSLQVQGTDVDIVLTIMKGKGTRQDITLSSAGMTGYRIITPTEGWSYMPFNGQMAPEAITPDELAQDQDDMDPEGPFINYKAKGHKIEYLGKEDVEGTEAYKLKAEMKGGKVETFFIDPSSYMVIRTVVKQKVNGQEVEQQTDLSNYEKLPEGIVMPKTITLPFGELNITSVVVNGNVDESTFKKPD